MLSGASSRPWPIARSWRRIIDMTVVLELTEDQEKRLREAAKPLGVSPDDLVKAALNDLLAQPASDFEAAAKRVLEKNHELYKRLA